MPVFRKTSLSLPARYRGGLTTTSAVDSGDKPNNTNVRSDQGFFSPKTGEYYTWFQFPPVHLKGSESKPAIFKPCREKTPRTLALIKVFEKINFPVPKFHFSIINVMLKWLKRTFILESLRFVM